ncbi:MAG: hypothetical protein AB7S41_17245 [Parvibaculaceae bacterium]
MRHMEGLRFGAAVLVAGAMIAASAPTPAEAHGKGALVGGLIAGALVGGAIAASAKKHHDHYYYGGPVYPGPGYYPPPPPPYAPVYCGVPPYPPCY